MRIFYFLTLGQGLTLSVKRILAGKPQSNKKYID